ncbi:MRS2-A, partial [Symbiodinium microadriaticum]
YLGAELNMSGEIDFDARVGRRHLVEEFGLKPRDIAAMFSKNARRGFGLSVRRGGALLSLGRDGPSVVVANTTAFILPRDSRDKSLADVGLQIQQKFMDIVASVSEQHTAEEEEEEPGREPVPFALAVTEALLTIYLDKISGELEEAVWEANRQIRDYTAMRQDQAGTPQLERLRITKQLLDTVQSQAKSFQTVLLQALEDEDDLSDLAKSVGPTKEEWELCFEYYSQSAAEVDAEVSAHVEAMDDLENFWLLRLSERRLELEKSQLWLEVVGLG